jgi:hypothetical protein
MLDVRLKKTEKSEIFLLVQESGLNPTDFTWTDERSNECEGIEAVQFMISVLTHRPTEYFCEFGGYRIQYSPGRQQRVQSERHHSSWADKRGAAQLWLAELRKEVDAPDLWASIGQEKALSTAAASADLDNRLFTAAEQSLIATKLDEIKAYLLEGQQFAADQAEAIEREFAYLKESAERMGRKDWLNILLGGLFGLAVTLALDPEKARELMRLAGAVFQSLWGMAQGVLQ